MGERFRVFVASVLLLLVSVVYNCGFLAVTSAVS